MITFNASSGNFSYNVMYKKFIVSPLGRASLSAIASFNINFWVHYVHPHYLSIFDLVIRV